MGAPWEKYKRSESAAGPWQKYAETPTEETRPIVTGKGLLQGQIEALPLYGSVAGGLLGLPLGPLGAAGGAGLGAGLGKSAQQIIERFTEPGKLQSSEQMYNELAKEMAAGAAGEGAGAVLGKAAGGLAKMVPTKSPMAPAIEAAGSRLGVEPTEAMKSGSYFMRGLEQDLSKSPTIGGALTRRETEPVYKKIDEVTSGLLKEATSLSPYESGAAIKKGLISDIGERYQPIQMAYDEAGQATKQMPLGKAPVERVAKNIRSIEGVNLFPEYKQTAETFASALENAQSTKELGTIKTRAKEMLRDPSVPFDQKRIASEALSKLETLEQNSVMREAISMSRSSGDGVKIAKDLVGNLKSAAKEYKSLMQDIGTLAKGSKVTSGKYGVSNVLKEIDQVPAEKLPDMIFKTNDSEFLAFMKDKHPAAYNEARTQKLAQIMKKSTSPQDGQISPRKFMQAIKDLGPEARQHLFGDKVNSINDVKVLLNSIPEIFNPSGTARATQIKQVLNPITQLEDLGRYGLYKGLKYSGPIRPGLEAMSQPGIAETAMKGLILPRD